MRYLLMAVGASKSGMPMLFTGSGWMVSPPDSCPALLLRADVATKLLKDSMENILNKGQDVHYVAIPVQE